MRLIDADGLVTKILEEHKKAEDTYDLCVDEVKDILCGIVSLIDEQPTAYDLDKVVEQLKAVSYERYGNDGMGGERVVNLDDVVEIVKGGDVEPKSECKWKLEDAEGNLYATECKNRKLIFEGTPKENGYRYCPYCGRKIKAVE